MDTKHIASLSTEQINPASWNIDIEDTEEILTIINREDETVAQAVGCCRKEIAVLVDHAVERIRQGGRLIYVGAGTSGRLGILDASECPPTYGVSYEMVQGHIAGGKEAFIQAKEGAEDSPALGKEEMVQLHLQKQDTVVGIAASGRTPYVIAALRYAREKGCYTAAISCVKQAKLSAEADVGIEAITGPEVICGSTRMKAGTAQKLILNMISTAVMIRLGKVYHNYMVDVKATNQKLIARAIHMIQACCGCSEEQAKNLLQQSRNHVKTAILMEKSKKSYEECQRALQENQDILRRALRAFGQADIEK